MKNIIVTIILVVSISPVIYAQRGNYNLGARAAGLSYAHLTLKDEWALFNNIGALSYTTKKTALAGYRTPYGLNELSSAAAGFIQPFSNGAIGIGFFRFGQELFNEHRVNLGLSHRLGIISLGINVSYYQVDIEQGLNRKAFLFDIGGHSQLTPKIIFAAFISNLSQTYISEVTKEKVPTYLKMELGYRPSQNLLVNVGIDKAIDETETVRIGVEYEIVDRFMIRTGLNTIPFESSFGLGFKSHKLSIDYAYRIHPQLGGTHDMSLSYKLG